MPSVLILCFWWIVETFNFYYKFEFFILEYVRKYATEEALREQEQHIVLSDSESSMSDFSEDEAQDMEL